LFTGGESKVVERLKADPSSIKKELEKSTYTGLQKYGSNFNQLFSQRMQKYGQISVPGKPGEPGKPGIEGKPGKATTTLVSPAPQQEQQIARAQSISQPPLQQQSQVNILPMDLSGGGQQQASGGNIIPPPSQPKQGPTVPFLSLNGTGSIDNLANAQG
jgi:hypothetical protein